MKHGQGYELNFADKSIILTKAFAAKAGKIESEAYALLLKLKQDYPEYEIKLRSIEKKPGKKTYAKLTYGNMKMYIEEREGRNSAELKELERIIELAKSSKGPYAYVKHWFLQKYPSYEKMEFVA